MWSGGTEESWERIGYGLEDKNSPRRIGDWVLALYMDAPHVTSLASN